MLASSVISAVNVAEVTSRAMKQGASVAGTRALLSGLNMAVAPLDAEHALLTGELHRRTRAHGLSLGDCACLALGQARGLPVVTADRAWRDLGLGVEVVLIR